MLLLFQKYYLHLIEKNVINHNIIGAMIANDAGHNGIEY